MTYKNYIFVPFVEIEKQKWEWFYVFPVARWKLEKPEEN